MTKTVSDGTFEELECALSYNKHFVKEPVLLSNCGHCVCKKCLPCTKDTDESIKCVICQEVTDIKLITPDKECLPVKKNLLRNVGNLLKIIDEKTKNTINHILNSVDSDGKQLNAKIDYIKEELEIRIYSLKTELDELLEELKNELDVFKDDLIQKNQSKLGINEKLRFFEKELENLEAYLKENKMHSDSYLYKYQDNLQDLIQFSEIVEEQNYHMDFEISTGKLSKDLIASFSLKRKNELKFDDVKSIFEIYDSEVVDLVTNPNDVCVLQTGNLLMANTTQKNLTLFDQNLNLMRTIEKFDDVAFSPSRIACDDIDRIYIIDHSIYQVLMLDLNLKKVKGVGSKGNNVEQFDLPNGIAYFSNKIYVCDTNNKRLQILTSDLEFKNSIPLEYQPWLIKISKESTACISRYDKGGIFFYDLEKFTLNHKYDFHGHGRISSIHSNFYESCHSNSKIYFYDPKGLLTSEIDVNKYKSYLTGSADGALAVHGGNLIFTSYNQKKIVKLFKE